MNEHLQFSFTVTPSQRVKITKHPPKLIWITGLSGSGKSTLANALEVALHSMNYLTYVLDGDNIRSTINSDLGFTKEDRTENLRRAAEVCKILMDAGVMVIAAFLSPLESQRSMVKEIAGVENYIEIYLNTSIEECERRDAKGLYKKAKAGLIANFTGISSIYEEPSNPFITISTENADIKQLVESIIAKLNL
jgi:adenylylsulfate kinase (apsK)